MSDAELIARLRELASWEDGVGVMQDFYCGDEMIAAADRIEALIAENAKLHDHIEGAAKGIHKIMVGYEAKLATCEKYRDAYAECDRIGTQAVRDLEAKLAKAVDWFETIRDRAKGDYMAHTYYLDAIAALATIKAP